MQTRAARIGKHVQDVVFWLVGLNPGSPGLAHEKSALIPDGLPFWFENVERVWFAAFAHAGRGQTVDMIGGIYRMGFSCRSVIAT